MLTLKLQETMSGWIELSDERQQEPLSFSIDVVFTKRLQPWKPQPFTGILTLPDRAFETATHGHLTLKPSGPRYELEFRHPDLGWVTLEGEKTYDLSNLKESLTVCPLTVFQDGNAVGYAEVAYRDSILAFPFRSLRLVQEDSVPGYR